MKKFFKLFLIFAILFGVFVMPLNSALAMKWNRALIIIYVPNDTVYDAMMKKAVAEWQGKTKKMSIVVTQQPRDLPLVEVDTTFNKLTGDNVKNACSVQFSTTANYFRHAKIVIDVNETPEILSDAEKKQENLDEIYAVMLKAVGQMLGVPESSDSASVMAKEYVKGQKLLPSDVDNFYKVYGWVSTTPHRKR